MSDVAYAPQRSAGTAAGAAAVSRPLRRRSSLPTGRAVVGGLLVALSALGIFAAYTRATAGPTQSYAVARRDLPLGGRLTAEDVVLLPMELPPAMAERAGFSSVRSLEGATVVGPIRRGELVQPGDVVRKRSGPAELEISFAIEASRAVAGSLRPGEEVDVLATFGGGADSYSVIVVRHARVLAAVGGGSSLAQGRSETITLAVSSSEEALALAHAINAGEVTLVRATGSSGSGPPGQTYRAPAQEKPRSGGA
ncbi:MAG: hypothetical protein KY454_03600 [Actinobacteria bacterium]|nr:hypothetical protein [Actinomycetota bacterium]MBW3649360.1 hypothetical protein [Actinomycetota bacterium]